MAIRLAKLGCRLALWDLQKDPLEKLSAELVAMGIPTKDIKTYVADVSDRVKVYELAKQVYTDFGKVDILINNAGKPISLFFCWLLQIADQTWECRNRVRKEDLGSSRLSGREDRAGQHDCTLLDSQSFPAR